MESIRYRTSRVVIDNLHYSAQCSGSLDHLHARKQYPSKPPTDIPAITKTANSMKSKGTPKLENCACELEPQTQKTPAGGSFSPPRAGPGLRNLLPGG